MEDWDSRRKDVQSKTGDGTRRTGPRGKERESSREGRRRGKSHRAKVRVKVSRGKDDGGDDEDEDGAPSDDKLISNNQV